MECTEEDLMNEMRDKMRHRNRSISQILGVRRDIPKEGREHEIPKKDLEVRC